MQTAGDNKVNNIMRDESSLVSRERHLSAIISLQQKLLITHEPQKVYDEALNVLGRASGASRVYIFENSRDANGRLLMSQKAEWCAEGITPEIDNPFLQNLTYQDSVPRWVEILSKGKIINSLVKDLPQDEQNIIKSLGVLSVLSLPFIVNGEFFGFMGFDNCVEERVWNEFEIELLQAASQAFSLAHERKLAEKSLHETQEHFGEIFDNTDDLIYLRDLKGKFISVNKTCERVMGYTVEDLPNISMADIMSPEDVELTKRMTERKLSEKAERTVYEIELITKDGRRVPVETSTRVIHRDGKPAMILGIARDITKRKHDEEELTASQERFFKAFNASPWAIVITKLSDGTVIDVNQTALFQSGFERDELIGRKIPELHIWNDLNDRSQMVKMISETGSIRGREVALHDKENKKRTMLMSAELLRINDEECILWSANDITERKETEQALRLSEERYRSLVEATEQTIWSGDLEGNITKIHSSLIDPAKWNVLSGWGWLYLVHPEDRETVREIWEQAVKTGERYADKYRYLRDDGSYGYASARAVPIHDNDGTIKEWIGSTVDVTKRVTAEKALRESEERYRAFVENSTEAIWRCEIETPCPITLPVEEQIKRFFEGGILAECNDVMAKMYGYERAEEIIGAKLESMLPPDAPESFEFLTGFILSNYSLTDVESKEVDKEGNTKYFSNSFVGMIENGHIKRAWGTQRDITERKKAENALRETNETLQALIHSAPVGIIVMGLDGKVKVWNSVAEKVLGWQKEDNPGFEWGELIPEEYKMQFRQMREQILNGEVIENVETVRLKKDGTLIDVVVSGSPLRDAEGNINAILSVFHDITERKRAEKALHESEERLRQAQKMEAIGRLAGGIAHDFNNILTSVIGYSDISLRRLSENDPLHRNIREIRKSADRAAKLTHQLLAYSRKQILQPTLLDLNEIVFELDKMMRRVIGEDVLLKIELNEGLGKIKADRGQVEQVLMNLVVNARDAMPKGGEVLITTKNVVVHEPMFFKTFSVPPDKYVLLQVSDTGHGMSEEVKQKIFDPFFTTKEVGKGTGLGLATVYGIIKQSDGYIIVESELEKGTEFNIYMPLSEDKEKRVESEPASPAEAVHGMETILLVEDDEAVRMMTREVLESSGYQVLSPINCDEAIDFCQKYRGTIHLLLTDVVMPKINGRELAERLTQMRPKMKVLYMSGYTDAEIVDHGVLENDVKFIQKPYTIDALTRIIRELLDVYDED